MTDRISESRQWVLAAAEKIVKEIDPPAEQPDGGVLVRAALLVIDVMHPDSGRQMYVVGTNPAGDAPPQWERDGLLHYALYDFVAVDSTDDGDE